MLEELRTKLEQEIERLTHELQVVLPRAIKTAVEHGDLRENSEYKSALAFAVYLREADTIYGTADTKRRAPSGSDSSRSGWGARSSQKNSSSDAAAIELATSPA